MCGYANGSKGGQITVTLATVITALDGIPVSTIGPIYGKMSKRQIALSLRALRYRGSSPTDKP